MPLAARKPAIVGIAGVFAATVLLTGCVTIVNSPPPASDPPVDTLAECNAYAQILADTVAAIDARSKPLTEILEDFVRETRAVATTSSELSAVILERAETLEHSLATGEQLPPVEPNERTPSVICGEVGVTIAEIGAGSSGGSGAVPSGFSDVGTGLAVRWVVPADCGSSTCEQIEVFAIERCPSRVFLEANVLDSMGRVIGVTRDEIGGLPEGQIGLLTFEIAKVNYSHLELVQADCL